MPSARLSCMHYWPLHALFAGSLRALFAELARKHAAFDIQDFLQPPGMARCWAVASAKKRSDDLEGELRPDDPSPDAQNIHIVVLDTLPSRVSVMAQAGPNAWEFVGSDADPHPRTTHQNPAIDLPSEDLPSHRLREIREIASIRGVRSTIQCLHSKLFQEFGHLILHEKASMVACDCVTKWLGHEDLKN